MTLMTTVLEVVGNDHIVLIDALDRYIAACSSAAEDSALAARIPRALELRKRLINAPDE
mgnify:FL=1